MGSLTNYAENAVLEHLTRETAYTPAATLYLALCTGDPGEAATGASCNECGNSATVAIGEIAISIASATLSNYAANGMLDRMFRNQSFTISANALGLATATISDSTTGSTVTEVANSNGYARLAINAAGGAQPSWASAGSASVTSNANQWTMPTPSGSWGTVVASFIANNATHASGEILIYDNGITDQAVGTDDVVYYATGQFSLTVA